MERLVLVAIVLTAWSPLGLTEMLISDDGKGINDSNSKAATVPWSLSDSVVEQSRPSNWSCKAVRKTLHGKCNYTRRCSLENNAGQENWTVPNEHCLFSLSWEITVPDGHWIILKGDVRDSWFRHERLKTEHMNKDLGITPKHVIKFQSVKVSVLLDRRSDLNRSENIHPGWKQSSVALTFTAHAIIRTPPVLYGYVHYNCSSPYTVPELWKCDGDPQCLNHEDEPLDCPYRSSSHCGLGWVPIGDDCLRFATGVDMLRTPEDFCTLEHGLLTSVNSSPERSLQAMLTAWPAGTSETQTKRSLHKTSVNQSGLEAVFLSTTQHGPQEAAVTQRRPPTDSQGTPETNTQSDGQETMTQSQRDLEGASENIIQKAKGTYWSAQEVHGTEIHHSLHEGSDTEQQHGLQATFTTQSIHTVHAHLTSQPGQQAPYGSQRQLGLQTASKTKRRPGAQVDETQSFYTMQAPFSSQRERDEIVRLLTARGLTIPLFKVRPISDKLAHLYKHLWQWGGKGSPITYQFIPTTITVPSHPFLNDLDQLQREFNTAPQNNYLMKTNICIKKTKPSQRGVHLGPALRKPSEKLVLKTCSDRSLVQLFHHCNEDGDESEGNWSQAQLPLFPCIITVAGGMDGWTFGPHVHFTLTCDGVQDCLGGSDENSCDQVDWSLFRKHGQFVCRRPLHVIPDSARCNDVPDCFDGIDEDRCYICTSFELTCSFHKEYTCRTKKPIACSIPFQDFLSRNHWDSVDPPALIELDGYGLANVTRMAEGERCPETHFQCLCGYCIPTYLLNNGEQDCPEGEDEKIPREIFTCPGFYRCYGSGSCVHADYVCDGIPHCPNKDDERYCHLQCPHNCTCEGYAFTCRRQVFDPLHFVQVRYLDVSGMPQPSLKEIEQIPLLRFLNLSGCGLSHVFLRDMPLLNVLDLSLNRLQGVKSVQLRHLSGLTHLYLSNNQLAAQLDRHTIFPTQAPSLHTLALAQTLVTDITVTAFEHMQTLNTLDLRHLELRSLSTDVFSALRHLHILRASDARLCCDFFHSQTSLRQCEAPADQLSSCSDLLRSDLYRVCLWTFTVLAVTGNAGVLVYRLCWERKGASCTHHLLVANLSLSDLLMGVYTTIIGSADAVFRGQYVAKDGEWRQSTVCTVAGFLGLLSSEVSVFIVCLITLDRFLAICLPFHCHLHFTRLSVVVGCLTVWVVGLVLAAVPLLLRDWQFYSQSGICLPLPTAQSPFPGRGYIFTVFIVINLMFFLAIGAGHMAIFCFTHRPVSTNAALRVRHLQEVALARRLALIVMTDFCCWFSIGLLGLLTYVGVSIPDLGSVFMALFILPLNSALNPLLYTVNAVLARRAADSRQANARKRLCQLKRELRSWSRETSTCLIRFCVQSGLVDDTNWKRTN